MCSEENFFFVNITTLLSHYNNKVLAAFCCAILTAKKMIVCNLQLSCCDMLRVSCGDSVLY